MAVHALIDADLIAYRCAATCEDDPEAGIVLSRVNDLTERILADVDADGYTLYLSGGNNFRKEIDPLYKANRKDKPRPKWLQACREFLVTDWQAQVTDGIEADDALGIAQKEDTIICSLDKDLLQIPGRHYQWEMTGRSSAGKQWTKEAIFYDITQEESLRRFWTQMIVGDVADNVRGIEGLGPVKSASILSQVCGDSIEELNKEYYEIVSNLYNNDSRLHSNAILLWVLRNESEICLSKEARIEAVLKRNSQPYSPQISLKPVTNETKLSSSNPVVSEPIVQIGQ